MSHRVYLGIGLVVIVVLTVGTYVLFSTPAEAPVVQTPQATSTPSAAPITFTLEERMVTEGETLAVLPVPTLETDLNGDGTDDSVVVLREVSEGSGTFYYLAAVLNRAGLREGGVGYYLGDRIVVEDIRLGRAGTFIVDYLERSPGVAMAEAPTEPMERVLRFDGVSKSFVATEGGAMQKPDTFADTTLVGTRWQWESARYEDGRVVVPTRPEAFVLTLAEDGRFSATTDCNGVGGSYVVDGVTLTFSQMLSTMMYCEGSDEGTFTTLLGDTTSFRVTDGGELVLGLKFDSGTVRLVPLP